MAETTTLGAAELEALIAAALVASNTAQANARSVARALTQAEIDGQKGHGLSRVPTYTAQARVGKVDGHARSSFSVAIKQRFGEGKVKSPSVQAKGSRLSLG